MIHLLLALQLALPNTAVTPGAVRKLSLTTMCATNWGRDVRKVTDDMRHQVFALYGIPYELHAQYEVDHEIPRSIGGADKVSNLWPQPLDQARRLKDPLEIKLSKLICDPTSGVTVAAARRAIRGDWRVAYRKYMGREPVMP